MPAQGRGESVGALTLSVEGQSGLDFVVGPSGPRLCEDLCGWPEWPKTVCAAKVAVNCVTDEAAECLNLERLFLF